MVLNSFDRVQSFLNLVPFIQKYVGSIFVIKYGGAAMTDISLTNKVIEDILFLYYLGIKPVVIHGGGPSINSWLTKLDIKPQFQDGIRLTDSSTMKIVEMVLLGEVNPNLVSCFNKVNKVAIGLSGKDSQLIEASPYFDGPNNFVGKVDMINNDLIHLLLNNKYIPVIASIASDTNGQSYNINADTVASAIASSLKADKLILLTDTLGLLSNPQDSSTLIKELNIEEVNNLKYNNIISGGMIPKINACINALNNNVNYTHIIDGRLEHSLLYELFTLDRIGSRISI
uniref:Acetylglutamate kinase n=1 Tax=Plumaria plumosa TaxID=189642 RepID=A0A4D6X011_9FLOR|nr:acetylglutamate kinase [Plumaria plumosa]